MSMEPDQIDMMNENALREELRKVLILNSEMRMLIIDLQATLRTCYNTSKAMLNQCEDDRKRLGI